MAGLSQLGIAFFKLKGALVLAIVLIVSCSAVSMIS